MRIAILGAGYTGRALASELLRAGHEVIAVARTATTLEPETSRPLGLETRVASTLDESSLSASLVGADRVIHLAPPPRDGQPEADAARVARSVPKGCSRIIYGSTTGVFARPEDPKVWVDETSPVSPAGQLGRARYAYEQTLIEQAPAPVHILRIAGIYGPTRTLATKLRRGELCLFEGGSVTSRIHRDDLVRLLSACVTAADPPRLVVATDDEPAPTLDVARFTARLLDLPPPPLVSRREAETSLSPRALELRLGGKRCRSMHRRALIGPLLWPTYREGVRASLQTEGLLAAPPQDG